MKNSRSMRAAEAIAHVRTNLNTAGVREFKTKDLITSLKNHNCPFPAQVVSSLIKVNAIVPVKYGVYTFKSEDPIYYGSFEKVLEEKTSIYFSSKKEKISESEMIALLKSKGYKILKPVTEYKEV